MSDPTESFEALHDRLRGRLTKHLQRLVGPADSEDLAQDVLLKIHHHLPDFRGESQVSTWAFQIATHAAVDHLRRPEQKRTTVSLEATAEVPCPPTDPDRQDMRHCIRTYIQALPPVHAEVLRLSELEELDLKALAERLGISEGAAKIRLHRARRLLRSKLSGGCRIGIACDGELACERVPNASVERPQSGGAIGGEG